MMSTQVQEKNIVRIFAKIISFLFTLSFIITSALPIKANSEIPNISVVQINKILSLLLVQTDLYQPYTNIMLEWKINGMK
jgi:hypothetical protein